MSEESIPDLPVFIKATVSRFVQFLQERNVPVEKAHEGLEVAYETIMAEDENEILFRMLATWFESASGGTIQYNSSFRAQLAGEFRAAAWMYEKGAVIYPWPGHSSPAKRQDEEKMVLAPPAVVCSDIHLGTQHSRSEAFFEWLGKCRDTTIVLLGDILDLWVYSSNFDDEALARHVAAQWIDLWQELAAARDRNCQIHYVPGNHDAFVYFIESEGQDPWSQHIIERTPLLNEIASLTEKFRFVQLTDIHYPCLQLKRGDSEILLTHGHYAAWGWRLMAGRADAVTPLPTAVASACVVLAHKNAAALRKVNNQRDWWLSRTHLIEDTAISITNALLTAYKGAWSMMSQSPDDFTELLDRASALYFGAKTRVSSAERLRIREALLFIQRGEERKESELEEVKAAHIRYLSNRLSGTNGHLSLISGQPEMSTSPLSMYANFDKLVFGHFHNPRDGICIHDTGGFVDFVESFISIEASGEVHRRPLP